MNLSYNADFQVVAASVNGNTVNYGYDNDGLLLQAGSLQLSHHAQNGLLLGTQLGNVTTQHSYNNFGELQEETASYQSSPLFHSYYVRDKVGRITQKLETFAGLTISTEYAYDVAGRLIEVKQNGSVVETYQYDANGNRLNNNAVYDAQDRLLQYASNTYTYTQNGELLTKNTTTFNYDVLGNLRQVQLPGKTVDYVIDARNRRVGKKVNGQLVQGWLYQGSLKPVAELNGTGQIVARFVYGSKANIPDYIVKNGSTYRVISDHLGSPRFIVDIQTGVVIQRMEFDAFGNVTFDSNPGFQPFGFAGGLYDLDTKLVRFGARDYDAETGRWTSKDPIGFKARSANFYQYVSGDPINFIDITGKSSATASGRVGFVVGNMLGGPAGGIVGGAIGAVIGIGLAKGIDILLNEGTEDASKKLPNLDGVSDEEAEKALEEAGFSKKPSSTEGGYQEWTHPDGSQVWVRPNGEIVRTGSKRWAGDGRRKYRPRYGADGGELPYSPGSDTHSTGECIKR